MVGMGPVVGNQILFDIDIPSDHPKGIFWFHPHVHGLSKMQVSGGMAGMIAIGSIDDYACLRPGSSGNGQSAECDGGKPTQSRDVVGIREFLLKDAELVNLDEAAKRGAVLFDEVPDFCGDNLLNPDQSFCQGAGDHVGGRWVFSVNGVSDPSWAIEPGRRNGYGKRRAKSEIWRIQNASANITYNLCLDGGSAWPVTPETDTPSERCAGALPFQVLSLDGVAFAPSGGAEGSFVDPLALQRRVLLMPGSRIEILVSWRDPAPGKCTKDTPTGCPAAAPAADETVSLRALKYATGGDDWPEVRLASVTFRASDEPGLTNVSMLAAPRPTLFARAFAARAPGEITRASSLCRTGLVHDLQPGEKRRVYFGIIDDHGTEHFLLGTTVIDADGQEVDEAGQPVTEPVLKTFDMNTDLADLCVYPGPEPTETWQLVNISKEVHNFHIHQGKFRVADCAGRAACSGGGANGGGSPQPRAAALYAPEPIDEVNVNDALIQVGHSGVSTFPLHDTIVVPRGRGSACEAGAIDDQSPGSFIRRSASFDQDVTYRYVRSGGCDVDTDQGADAGWIEVEIPFDRTEAAVGPSAGTSVGKYVFHCHILEHEDNGMMASIRVLSDEQWNAATPRN